jgi:hypothetical protein
LGKKLAVLTLIKYVQESAPVLLKVWVQAASSCQQLFLLVLQTTFLKKTSCSGLMVDSVAGMCARLLDHSMPLSSNLFFSRFFDTLLRLLQETWILRSIIAQEIIDVH